MHLTFPTSVFWEYVFFPALVKLCMQVVLIHERKLVRLDPTATVVDGGLSMPMDLVTLPVLVLILKVLEF